MIRYLYADQLAAYPRLAAEMFRHRAQQFHHRQKWEVSVDANGEEHDQYDALNPLYVIWETPGGGHGGSMRFLPTVGRTMVNDHFQHLTDGVHIASPLIWECSRFCLSPEGIPSVSAALMQAGGEIMEGFGIAHFVGVFDARMVRIYRMIGAAPIIVGAEGTGRDCISVGLWECNDVLKARVAKSAGVSAELSRHWFERAFGRKTALQKRRA
ncbi:acyl-homoserine-lactone synthase [Palleronia sp. KMU-117]|uniref:acyl-homoserine-lactone synthase n=1 Tax=Palleronia sp. KMU-117 TaxID=3434108 RepID=UPI003D760B25